MIDEQIDRQISEVILGRCWHEDANGPYPFHCHKCAARRQVDKPWNNPAYSSDISAAFELVEWLRGKGWAFAMNSLAAPYNVYRASFSNGSDLCEGPLRPSPAMAICLAALNTDEAIAKTVKDSDEACTTQGNEVKDINQRAKTASDRTGEGEGNMKIIAKHWFNESSGCIGIVIGENEVGERKAYIARVSGFDEDVDAQYVLDYGGKLTLSTAQQIVSQITPQEEQ